MRAELIASTNALKKGWKLSDVIQGPPHNQYWLPGLFAEIYLCFLFWCQIIDLMPTIWFQPMSQLTSSETGEEYTYIVGYYGFMLLYFSRFRKFVTEEPSLAYSLGILGVLSYATNSLVFRTVLLALSLIFGSAVHFMQWWIPKRRQRAAYCQVLGLFVLVSFRFMFTTLTPIWFNMATTWSSFGLGIVAAGLLSNDPEFLCITEESEVELQIENSRSPRNATWVDTIRLGIGFGTLYFLSHWLLTSHGILARWIGVSPFYFGIGMLGGMCLGICLWHYEQFVRSPFWYFLGLISAVSILVLPATLAWIPALIVTTFVTSLWSVIILDLAGHSYMVPALLLGVGTYTVFNFALAWSVAWCFVPKGTGGPFMRQRAGQVLVFSHWIVGLGFFKSTSSYFQNRLKNSEKLNRLTPQMLFALIMIVVCITTPALLKRSYHVGNNDGRGVQTEYISGAIWAIRFGYDNFGWPNFVDVGRKIKEVGANTIGLVESDTYRPFNGNRDVVEYLEEALHMYSDYGPSTLNDTWGCALLTVFPIVRVDRVNQPSPDGEVACLIDATLDVNGQLIDVIVTHFGNTEHYRDRYLQARSISHRIRDKKKEQRPIVWLGYLTDRPGGPNYKQLTDAGLEDASPSELERYCLYLFHAGMKVSDFRRIEMTEDISDTEIQMASFRLAK